MAVQTWQDLSIMYGGYELACHAKSFEAPTIDVDTKDVTPLCTTGWKAHLASLKAVTWSAEVMQDFSAGEVDEMLGLSSSAHAAATALSILPAGITDGSLAYTFRANQLSYSPINAQIGEVAMANMNGNAFAGPVVRGRLLLPAAMYDTSDTGVARQLGAVSATQKLYAALHVFAVDGSSPELDVIVRSDSADTMATPTTRITFATADTAGTWQWATADGAITDTWFDIDYTIAGSGAEFTFAVVVGVA